jgi:signal transduction histidine kinase
MTLDRLFVESSALGFQALVTALLAVACYGLWLRQGGVHFITWSAAWTVYVVRLACIVMFLQTRDTVWLFAHQAAASISALLLLLAALQLSKGYVVRPVVAIATVLGVLVWSWVTIYAMHSMVIAGITSALLLSAVTIWTGLVFWRDRHLEPTGTAPVLAWAFMLWGGHHLDYPLFRQFGASVLYGVFVDVLFVFTIGLSMLFLALGNERRKLASRSQELEQLTRLLLRAQEDERRRISRELHDEAGQVLTAVKIELDLEGREAASALVARAMAQVRDISNLLRPSVLDDLGLMVALRTLVEDFSRQTQVSLELDDDAEGRRFPPDVEVVIYRVVQEALTNIARHAHASSARVQLHARADHVQLIVEDDGRGAPPTTPTAHLGLLGMQERLMAVGGRLTIGRAAGGGVRLDALIPLGHAS